MSCPRCGHSEWKLLSLIHLEGISNTSSKTIGVGVAPVSLDLDEIGAGVGTGSTSGKSQTQLSEQTAPPEKPEMLTGSREVLKGAMRTIAAGFIILFLCLILNSDAGFWVFLGVCLIFMGLVLTPILFFIVNVQKKHNPEAVDKLKANERRQKEYQKRLEEYNKTRMCLRCGNFYINSESPKKEDSGRSKQPSEENYNSNPDEKVCPYCAETIKAAAILCKHCNSKIESTA